MPISAKKISMIIEEIAKNGVIEIRRMKNDPTLAPLFDNLKFIKKALENDQIKDSIIEHAGLNVVRELVLENGEHILKASEEARQDKVALFRAVTKTPEIFSQLNFEFLPENDLEEISFSAVKGSWKNLEFVDKKYKLRKNFVQEGLNQSFDAINLINPKIVFHNKTIALSLISKMPENVSLKQFSNGLRKDFDIIGGMLQKDPKNIRYVLGKERDNVNFAMSVVEKDPSLYKNLSKKMQQHELVAKIMVRNDSKNLRKLGRVAYQYNVVLEAVSAHGLALKFYSRTKYASDMRIIRAAITQDGEAFKYISKKLRKDKNLLLTAVAHVQGVVLKNHPLHYTTSKNKRNHNIMLQSVTHEPLSLMYGKGKTLRSFEIVKKAVKGDGLALQYAKGYARHNSEVIQEALINDIRAIKFVDKKFFNNKANKSYILNIINARPELYENLSQEFQQDPDVLLLGIKGNSDVALNIPLELRKNKVFMKQVAQVSKEAFDKAVSIELSDDQKFMKEMKEFTEGFKPKQGTKTGEKAKKAKVEEAKTETVTEELKQEELEPIEEHQKLEDLTNKETVKKEPTVEEDKKKEEQTEKENIEKEVQTVEEQDEIDEEDPMTYLK